MKKQLWLRPDQVDLVTSCLVHVKNKIVSDTVSINDAHHMASRFTARRIDEVLNLLFETPTGKDK